MRSKAFDCHVSAELLGGKRGSTNSNHFILGLRGWTLLFCWSKKTQFSRDHSWNARSGTDGRNYPHRAARVRCICAVIYMFFLPKSWQSNEMHFVLVTCQPTLRSTSIDPIGFDVNLRCLQWHKPCADRRLMPRLRWLECQASLQVHHVNDTEVGLFCPCFQEGVEVYSVWIKLDGSVLFCFQFDILLFSHCFRAWFQNLTLKARHLCSLHSQEHSAFIDATPLPDTSVLAALSLKAASLVNCRLREIDSRWW